MGQKIHPLGFRLGITQNHKSLWYSNFDRYSNILKEDYQIRSYFNNKKHKISNIYINRTPLNNQIQVKIETNEPQLLIKTIWKINSNFLNKLRKILSPNCKLIINLRQIKLKNVNSNASLLADLLVDKLESRVTIRRAMRYVLKKAQKSNINGIKIQISGRLNGAEMARSEWTRKGRVPLQTFNSNIDYSSKEAYTIFGVLGVKIWLFKS